MGGIEVRSQETEAARQKLEDRKRLRTKDQGLIDCLVVNIVFAAFDLEFGVVSGPLVDEVFHPCF